MRLERSAGPRTTLNEVHALSERTLKAIQRVQVILATGRPLRSLQPYVAQLTLQRPVPTVCFNGTCAALFDPKEAAPQVLLSRGLTRSAAESIIQMCDDRGWCASYCLPNSTSVCLPLGGQVFTARGDVFSEFVGLAAPEEYEPPLKIVALAEEPFTQAAKARAMLPPGAAHVVAAEMHIERLGRSGDSDMAPLQWAAVMVWFPQALGLRVIVAGLGRTGTMSMLTALQRLGYKPYHLKSVMLNRSHASAWRAVAEHHMEAAEVIEMIHHDGFDATMDNPMCELVELQLRLFPEAKVILTTHPRAPWTTGPLVLRFLPADVNKGDTLLRLCNDHLGIRMDEVIAFGDNYNDMEMLTLAGEGVAMKNAKDELKEAANRVSEWSNDEDAVARQGPAGSVTVPVEKIVEVTAIPRAPALYIEATQGETRVVLLQDKGDRISVREEASALLQRRADFATFLGSILKPASEVLVGEKNTEVVLGLSKWYSDLPDDDKASFEGLWDSMRQQVKENLAEDATLVLMPMSDDEQARHEHRAVSFAATQVQRLKPDFAGLVFDTSEGEPSELRCTTGFVPEAAVLRVSLSLEDRE
eukprot:g12042.t1